MKIAFYEIEEWEKEQLAEKLAGHDLFFSAEPVNKNNLPVNETEILSVFVNSRADREVLENLPNLKFIATRSTGFDHIDLKFAESKGIKVSNVPSYGENTVAEYTFALILALSRKIYPAIKRVHEQGLFNPEGLRGFDLKDKILGVVGTGKIGAHVARMAKGFEMEILGYDPYPNKELEKKYNLKYLNLEDLLKQSDVISLHVPYMPATRHLINAENIKFIKPSAFLINTSRGGLVDTLALLEQLRTKKMAGAALDVLEEEGLITDELNLLSGHPNEKELTVVLADHELMHMENVIVTPHNAFNTQEAMERILQTTLANIVSFIGDKPTNVV